MITAEALQEAIAECLGKREPNREDCMMLAAFYTIQNRLYPDLNSKENFTNANNFFENAHSYSFADAPAETTDTATAASESVGEYGNSDFLRAVSGKSPAAVFGALDELMDDLKMINPKVYNLYMRKIEK